MSCPTSKVVGRKNNGLRALIGSMMGQYCSSKNNKAEKTKQNG
jgi:hypothetical protein